jgi:P27 family predicted phage terminase small subunit
MSGPIPMHPRLQALKGNPSKSRPRSAPPQPQVADAPPPPPERLSPYAREEWLAHSAELHRLGLLTQLDLRTFALYCEAAARHREAEELLAREGRLVVESADGPPRVHPAVRIASQAANDAIKFGAHFGLSPASRARLSLPEPKAASKFGGLIA